MIPELEISLRENSEEWGLPPAKRWSVLFHNNYHAYCSSINLLWFADRERFPQAVTKLSSAPQVPRCEFANLTKAHACAPSLVPRPLHCREYGAFWAVWMAGVPGLPVRNREQLQELAPSMVNMLGTLHVSLQDDKNPADGDRYRRTVVDPLRSLSQFGESERVRNGCALLLRTMQESWILSLAVVPQHGDLYHGNILHHRGEWKIVDWEIFGRVDFPFYDFFTLILSLLRIDQNQQFDRMLANRVPRLVETYAQKSKFSVRDLELLLPLTLANWFHVHWRDQHHDFCNRMYRWIDSYFQYPARWNEVFGIPPGAIS